MRRTSMWLSSVTGDVFLWHSSGHFGSIKCGNFLTLSAFCQVVKKVSASPCYLLETIVRMYVI